MEAISKLKLFGLTNNQAKLLKFFIESHQKENINEEDLTFSRIKEKFQFKRSFYRELLSDLTRLEFLKVINKTKPFVYRYNESNMSEIIQKGQNSYLIEQKNFDKKIKDLKSLANQKTSLKQIKEILKDSIGQLRLNDEGVSILCTLFSQKNGKIVPISMTIKEIIKKIGENKIRYNLKLLEERGFVIIKKIGRKNIYEPKDLVTIFKIEKNAQKKNWMEKKRLMQDTIRYFQTKPSIDQEEVQKFGGVTKLLNYLKLAKEEILIIHPFYSGKRDQINKKVQTIIENILSYTDSIDIKIKVLIAGRVEDLDKENIREILRKIPQIEVKVTSRLLNTFAVIIDSNYTIHSFKNNLDFILIQDDQTAKLYENEFYKSWNLSEDFRMQLSRHDELKKILKDEIKESIENYPIISEKKEEYEILHLGEEVIHILKNFLRQANREIILDFRGNIEKIQEVQKYFEAFFKDLIDFLKNRNIKVKLLFGINSWIVNKLDQIFIQLIHLISQGKLEFRVPTGKNLVSRAIIIDDSTLLKIITDHRTVSSYKALIIRNPAGVLEIKNEFTQIFEQGIDFRNAILQYDIDKELEKAARDSINKNPPIYNFGNQPIVMQGKKDVIEIMLNILKKAKREILVSVNPFIVSKDGKYDIFKPVYQKELFNYYFEIFSNKSKDGIDIKILRNSSRPLSKDVRDEFQIKIQLSVLLTLFPAFQMREIDLYQSNFLIIDKKILLIYEYLESNQIKLIILTESLLIKKYQETFQDAWDKALDMRLNWLINANPSLKKEIQNSFEKVDFQITLPERGEMRVYDAKYLRYIMNYLLDNTKNEYYMFLAAADYFIEQSKGKAAFGHMAMSYTRNVYKTVENKKVKTKVITLFQPLYLNSITDNDIEESLKLYPYYEMRFLPQAYQLNNIFAIFDHFIIHVIGEGTKGLFQLLVMNDINLRNNYLTQFNETWKNSVDFRQVFYEYGSKRTKEIIFESYKKIKLEKEYSSSKIQELFPIKKSIDGN
ncbi:MAG: hypothetical protein HWN67_22815 [Candidatus Helarchaeota archaeon]|nr:hypothetical protein [Candidatus Helarchaeota archaeon]